MDRKIISFDANEQYLHRTSEVPKVASGTVNYVHAVFNLGDNWHGFDKVKAVWFNDADSRSTELDASGRCVVPAVLLAHKGIVKVNLIGMIGDRKRLTTYPIRAIAVDDTARTDAEESKPYIIGGEI